MAACLFTLIICFSLHTNLTLFLTRHPRWSCASLLKILLLDKIVLAAALALVWVGLCMICAKVLRHFTVCTPPVGCYYHTGQALCVGFDGITEQTTLLCINLVAPGLRQHVLTAPLPPQLGLVPA